MARSRSSRKLKFAVIAGLVAAFGGFLLYVQREADGLRNAISVRYWEDRAQGLDEYEPQFAYLKRGPHDRKEVCITIDDGPHGQCTLQEIAALKQANAIATFFVVGKRMKQHPDLVRKLLAEGMEVGNHTETHPRLSTISMPQVQKEIAECEADFAKITGRRMTFFRPPGMRENDAILRLLKKMGYQTIGWNVGAHDFMVDKNDPKVTPAMVAALKTSPQQVAERVLDNVKNGSIILLHDQPMTAAALPTILKRLEEEGYDIVSCEEMMQHIVHPVRVAANPLLPTMRVVKQVPKNIGPMWLPEFLNEPRRALGLMR